VATEHALSTFPMTLHKVSWKQLH